MSKLNWDFRYVESRSKSGLHHSAYGSVVHGDPYAERLRPMHHRARINPWLCLAVILVCAWLLWKVVVG